MKLVFATNNQHKFLEIKQKLGSLIQLINLNDLGFNDEIPETHETILENAAEKAFFVYDRYHLNCFADDTGLEIDALSGEPGVYSARYAGENCSYDDNMNKVLQKMKNVKNRAAKFRTIIALVEEGKLITFEGYINGEILREKSGIEGFGYDPIFKPAGFVQSFAEMSLQEKNKISHRSVAVNKLVKYLINKYDN